MIDLNEWAYWQTVNETPVEPPAYHKCTRVTILRVYTVQGVRWVRYNYADYTTMGMFAGRDQDTEQDFRKMFPVRREFDYDGGF